MNVPPSPRTRGELLASGHVSKSVREELRENLLERLRSGKRIFEGVFGYDDTVVPAVENALLCGHDLIFLGERGQAKTRMNRQLAGLLAAGERHTARFQAFAYHVIHIEPGVGEQHTGNDAFFTGLGRDQDRIG